MTYNELISICERKKIEIKDVLKATGLTYVGLKGGLNNGSIVARNIPLLCNCIGITPNDFFGMTGDTYNYNHSTVQNGNDNNMQIIQGNIDTLKEQLAVKDEQIKQLLNLLSK